MRQRMKRALRLAGGLAVVAILGYAMWSDSTWDDVPDHLLRFDRAIEQCAENQACMDAVCARDVDRCDEWLNWAESIDAEAVERRAEAAGRG